MMSDFLRDKLEQRRKFLLGQLSSVQVLYTYYIMQEKQLSDIDIAVLAEIKEINNIIGKSKDYKYKIIKQGRYYEL